MCELCRLLRKLEKVENQCFKRIQISQKIVQCTIYLQMIIFILHYFR